MNETTFPELDSFGQEYKLHFEIFGGIGGSMTYSIAIECDDNRVVFDQLEKCFFRSYRKYSSENEFCSLGAYGRVNDPEYPKKYKHLTNLIDTLGFFTMNDLSERKTFGTSHFFVLQRKVKGKIEQIYLQPDTESAPIFKVLELFSELTPELKNCDMASSSFRFKSIFTN